MTITKDKPLINLVKALRINNKIIEMMELDIDSMYIVQWWKEGVGVEHLTPLQVS